MSRGYSPLASTMFAATGSSPNQTVENIAGSPGEYLLSAAGFPEKFETNIPIDYKNIGTIYANAGANRALMGLLLEFGLGKAIGMGANAYKVNKTRNAAMSAERELNRIINYKNAIDESGISAKENIKKTLDNAINEGIFGQNIDQFAELRNLNKEYPFSEDKELYSYIHDVLMDRSNKAASATKQFYKSGKLNLPDDFTPTVNLSEKDKSLINILGERPDWTKNIGVSSNKELPEWLGQVKTPDSQFNIAGETRYLPTESEQFISKLYEMFGGGRKPVWGMN
jgi:hypothetical protein